MENKNRAIYVEDLLRAICDDPHIRGSAFARVKQHIDGTPAVEVVRCKECEFSYEGLVNLMCGRCGQKKGDLRLGGVSVAEDHFCGYGKRREKA